MSIYVFSWEEFWAGSDWDGTCLGRLSSLVMSEVISTCSASHDFQSSYIKSWILKSVCLVAQLLLLFEDMKVPLLMYSLALSPSFLMFPLFSLSLRHNFAFLGSFVCPVLLYCLTVLLFKASANHTSWPALPGCITQEKYILMLHPCFWFPSWN